MKGVDWTVELDCKHGSNIVQHFVDIRTNKCAELGLSMTQSNSVYPIVNTHTYSPHKGFG